MHRLMAITVLSIVFITAVSGVAFATTRLPINQPETTPTPASISEQVYNAFFTGTPTPTLIPPEIKQIVPSGDLVVGDSVAVSGIGQSKGVIELMLGNATVVATTMVGEEQNWSAEFIPREAGSYRLSARLRVGSETIPVLRPRDVRVVTPTPTPTSTPRPTATATDSPTPTFTPTNTPTPDMIPVLAKFHQVERQALAQPDKITDIELRAIADDQALENLRSATKYLRSQNAYEDLTITIVSDTLPRFHDGVFSVEQLQLRRSEYRDQDTDEMLQSKVVEVRMVYLFEESNGEWKVQDVREFDKTTTYLDL